MKGWVKTLLTVMGMALFIGFFTGCGVGGWGSSVGGWGSKDGDGDEDGVNVTLPGEDHWQRENPGDEDGDEVYVTLPETTIRSAPPVVATSTTATFEFTCNKASCTFQCRLGSERWQVCTSPQTYTDLAEQQHTFYVKAIDGAGNEDPSPAKYTWRIEVKAWRGVAAGDSHTCAVATDGTLWCWGWNSYGQLGIGATDGYKDFPVQVGTETTWSAVTAGGNHSCGIKTNGTLWCWGDSTSGQLGIGATDGYKYFPVQVGTETTWSAVTAGDKHSCGIKTDGTLWCWGWNGYGQLGIGTADKNTPTQVGTETTWSAVTAAVWHSCGIKTNGTLWCWGDNSYGQLGDGTTTTQYSPTKVGTDTTWSAVTAGDKHSCGIKTDGTLWCWGDNSYGQLGIGTAESKNTPTQVGTDTTWSAVMAGGWYACGARSDQALWCWGDNSYGQLGDGTTTTQYSPTQVGTDTSWSAVATGSNSHICGIKTGGTLWCWGWNGYGQLGNGTHTGTSTPTQVGSSM